MSLSAGSQIGAWGAAHGLRDRGGSQPHDNRVRISVFDIATMREFLRGAVQPHILHHAAEREIHGTWRSRELAEHGYEISPGTPCPTLHRLESEGLLSSRGAVERGHPRRVYKLTAEGRKALRRTRKALKELSEGMLDD